MIELNKIEIKENFLINSDTKAIQIIVTDVEKDKQIYIALRKPYTIFELSVALKTLADKIRNA